MDNGQQTTDDTRRRAPIYMPKGRPNDSGDPIKWCKFYPTGHRGGGAAG